MAVKRVFIWGIPCLYKRIESEKVVFHVYIAGWCVVHIFGGDDDDFLESIILNIGNNKALSHRDQKGKPYNPNPIKLSNT